MSQKRGFTGESDEPAQGKLLAGLRRGVCLAAWGFGVFWFVLSASGQEPAWTPLRQVAQPRIHMGTAVKYEMLVQSMEYRAMVAREYDLVTPENALKWKVLRPDAKSFNFHQADAIVEFARTNHLLVRGHTLCWNEDSHVPKWLLDAAYTPAQARELLETHIKTVMTRYRGRVFCWDVVNEAVSNNPKGPVLNDGFWLHHLGPEYVELAFRYAHEADPQAELFYNDYDLGDPLGPKSERIYQLVKNLKERGVPINGVGLQSHYAVGKPPAAEALRANIERFAALGLKVHITELDVRLEGSSLPLATRLATQAKVYADVAQAALNSPDCEAIVTWGFSDRWGIDNLMREAEQKGTEFPQRLPFDGQLNPKPAAFALANVLRGTTAVTRK